ncbi:MAG TPA: hypothetical protein DIC57_10355, partial [Sphaerochaeta sp.]|nr:hypothetical protein [Sphaerochaeta sp.]
THEFVSESFHGRNDLFENTLPVWYVFTYDEVGNSITIERYAVERDGTISESTVSTLPLP